MPANRESLLAGRNAQPLTDEAVLRVFSIFRYLDQNAPVRYDPGQRTCFRVGPNENGVQVAEIVFGPDIRPGQGIFDPNSRLGVEAAAAHELSHFHRYQDGTELNQEALLHVDEALTSLDAVLRFQGLLSENDRRQLVADAMQRLHLYVQQLQQPVAGA
jgi:hypothetical protein